ncbi:MAG TPA: glycine--tRNA ligase [Actinomycetota bacterium]|jgi:glycyl-tRNA synthetase|nr:glycine--tRNA ligase [Actinomycetota bacterium]
METVVNLCKRRGIVFPNSEIYGGLRSTWDFGPLGVELKNNVKRAWWRWMVQLREDVVGLDSAIILDPKVWETSGHVDVFTDPLVECLSCHQRFRADHLPGVHAAQSGHGEDEGTVDMAAGAKCPNCGNDKFTDPRNFNLMFKTFLGPVQDDTAAAWLRPETAQGIFVDFKQVQAATRRKVPFGIAQIGKSFRNEITPGNFIYRTREFEQMEMEFFVRPGTDEEWHQHWIDERLAWWKRYGIGDEHLRVREHDADELSHYSKRTVDIEYAFPFTDWGELEGIANRTDFDLTAHQNATGKDLTYYDDERDEHFIPYVIEPAGGADRGTLAFLIDAYREDEAPSAKGGTEKRTYLKLHHELAPIKVAVLPLSRNEDLVPTAREVAQLLRPHWMIDYDDAGAIGRRYRRHDEIGTPYCLTVDFDTLTDKQITIRDRDTMQQERIAIADVVSYVEERLRPE